MENYQGLKKSLAELWGVLDAPDGVDRQALNGFLSEGVLWRGMDPVGELRGIDAVLEGFWQPFRAAIPGYRRETHILMAGRSNGRADGQGGEGDWVAATGYLSGRMQAPFLGLPASDGEVRVRWAEFARFEGGRMRYVQFMVDLVDWSAQVGRPLLPPSRGVPFVYPAPTAVHGVGFASPEVAETEQTMALGRDLIFGGLNTFDEQNLASMGMARFFHPNLKWYGPGGINACLSLTEFQERHQEPWLIAFPDRKVQNLESLFADGPFLAASGYAGVLATQTGPFLGHAPQGRRLEISGLDFWLRTGDVFTENWVFVDMIRLFRQMGYDLMDGLG